MDIVRTGTTERASRTVTSGGVVYLSGQVAEDPEADIEGQTQSTLARVDAALAEAGTDRQHLLSATIYLRDIDNHFARMNSCLLYTSPSPRDRQKSRMPSSA